MSITKLRWDDDYDRCVGCGTRGQDKPHVAEGLCTDCFPAKYGGFGLDDVRPPWAEPGATLPALPAVPAKPWNPRWPTLTACLVCGSADCPHYGNGVCTRCRSRSQSSIRDGRGIVLVWLPFAADDPTRYSVNEARVWVAVRDLDEAWCYLSRRAAVGKFPDGGKAVIRRTKDAARLPERVIRRAE